MRRAATIDCCEDKCSNGSATIMLNLSETIARLDPASTILEDFKKKVDAISKVAAQYH